MQLWECDSDLRILGPEGCLLQNLQTRGHAQCQGSALYLWKNTLFWKQARQSTQVLQKLQRPEHGQS
jgi:hypothetical protein